MNKTMTRMIAALVVALPLAAHANPSWYILSGSEMKCKPAAGLARGTMASPNLLEQTIRAAGNFGGTTVTRNPDGSIFAVGVSDMSGMVIMYFPSQAVCMSAMENALKNGVLTHPNELK